MKTILLQLILAFCAALTTQAQDYNSIRLTHLKNQLSFEIERGAKVVITTSDNRIKGKISQIQDDALVIGTDTITFSEINILFAKTYSSKTSGVLLSILGGSLGTAGIYGTGVAIVEGGYSRLILLYSPALITVGTIITIKGVQMLSRGKRFKKTKWDFSPTIVAQ
ncbi:hypothetical protein [Mangrovibacterium diazotrophicum]|uniref:Preprotein translocase subunit YajC n=1 Tax=Mangrovibacterium diazotrophicum TaxID=1261403 RepID=A0A419VVD7_9BACT|nr:hypothetical protein [Mangrovibacterium diazotrophicum]RKD86130.1 hypothetical protein BC643_4447 [Mangrovibacterium diazotrophicum]